MKKSGWYVLILIVILIVAAVISISRIKLGGEPDVKDTTPPTEELVSPGKTPEVPEETPEDTPEAVPTQTPLAPATPPPSVNTPEPTATPTPTETPDNRTVLGQGSFSSDTGTALNLVVSWTARNNGDTAELQIDMSLSSYSLFTDALPGSISLTVNGESYTLDSPAIAYDGGDLISTPLASKTVSIPLDSEGKADPGITVLWNYRGSYGGTELGNIMAIDSAQIG